MIALALTSPLLFLALMLVLQRVEEAVFPPRRAAPIGSAVRPDPPAERSASEAEARGQPQRRSWSRDGARNTPDMATAHGVD